MHRVFILLKRKSEAVLVSFFVAVFRRLAPERASAIGGFLGRTFGRFTKAHKTALRNLAAVFPEKSEAARRAVALGMWENLGRTAAEFPHMPALAEGEHLVIEGKEHIHAAAQSDISHIFVSGHFANWETLPKSAALGGSTLALVYRHANNPATEKLIQQIRATYQSKAISKKDGTRDLVKTIRAGQNIGMLIDQKMNTGIPVPLFGRDAMTSPSPAHAALKYSCKLIPVKTERLDGFRFRVTFFPPLEITKTGDNEADTLRIMRDIHLLFEDWIRERPEQWFWAHNRWPKG